jgi:hypothetical protein
MNITIGGLFLASAVMTVGCAHAIARHDLFEQGDNRIRRVVETARQTCREQQPRGALPSVTQYERCVFDELRRDELIAAR